MAMNKKELAELEAAKTQAALRWTSEIKPDVEPPKATSPIGVLSTGWMYVGSLSDHPRVEVACSSSISHAIGRVDRTQSQQPIAIYSSRLKALKALRHEVEKRCAEQLRKIDKMIEGEKQ